MSYDKIEELQQLYADIKKYKKGIYFLFVREILVYIDSNYNYSDVVVGSDNKYFICTIYNILEKYVEEDYIVPIPKPKLAPTVLIGHGGSNHWRYLKDHLQDKHHIKVETYET